MLASSARRIVWIVDDSRLDAERAARVLARDYDIETFCDGSALLERLSSVSAPDVVVLDWVMPGITGLEVCRFLRESGGHSGLAVLLLTAHRHTEQIVEGLSAGANDYLAKPYQDEELRARVGALIRWRALLERAEQAEADHRRLLETAPDPLLVVDESGLLRYVNTKAAHVLGERASQLVGERLGNLIPALASSHLPPEPRESLLPPSDVVVGTRRFSPILTSARGSTTISLRDVTERRLIEERRLDFYSIIAHDLRTPLAAMTLRIANLLQGNNLHNHAAAKRDVEKLQERLASLVTMINDFLELASLEGAGARLQRVEVELPTLIDEIVQEYQPLLDRNRQSWDGTTCDASAKLSVLGDPKRIAQALSNLIGNAIKFTPAGGRVWAQLDSKPNYVEISICDTGAGVPAEAVSTLFERYTRAEKSVGGTGLGLMIVKEIADVHGGAVGVETSAGKGSRFWLRLPRGK